MKFEFTARIFKDTHQQTEHAPQEYIATFATCKKGLGIGGFSYRGILFQVERPQATSNWDVVFHVLPMPFTTRLH